MQSYGDIQATRSGLLAVSNEMKKLKLAPPVAAGIEVCETVPLQQEVGRAPSPAADALVGP